MKKEKSQAARKKRMRESITLDLENLSERIHQAHVDRINRLFTPEMDVLVDDIAKIDELWEAGKRMALAIQKNAKTSSDASTAIRKVREAVWYAVASYRTTSFTDLLG